MDYKQKTLIQYESALDAFLEVYQHGSGRNESITRTCDSMLKARENNYQVDYELDEILKDLSSTISKLYDISHKLIKHEGKDTK